MVRAVLAAFPDVVPFRCPGTMPTTLGEGESHNIPPVRCDKQPGIGEIRKFDTKNCLSTSSQSRPAVDSISDGRTQYQSRFLKRGDASNHGR